MDPLRWSFDGHYGSVSSVEAMFPPDEAQKHLDQFPLLQLSYCRRDRSKVEIVLCLT